MHKWVKSFNMVVCKIRNPMKSYSNGVTKIKLKMIKKKCWQELYPLKRLLTSPIKLSFITVNHKKISQVALREQNWINSKNSNRILALNLDHFQAHRPLDPQLTELMHLVWVENHHRNPTHQKKTWLYQVNKVKLLQLSKGTKMMQRNLTLKSSKLQRIKTWRKKKVLKPNH